MTSCTAPPRLHAHFMHVIPFIQSHPLITTSGIRSSQHQASAHHNITHLLITTSRICSSQHHASAHHNNTHRSSQHQASLNSHLSSRISHLASLNSQLSTLNSHLSSLIAHHITFHSLPSRNVTRRARRDGHRHACRPQHTTRSLFRRVSFAIEAVVRKKERKKERKKVSEAEHCNRCRVG